MTFQVSELVHAENEAEFLLIMLLNQLLVGLPNVVSVELLMIIGIVLAVILEEFN